MLAEMREMLGPMAKPLKLAVMGICVAALGLGVALLIDYGPQNMALSFACFVVIAAGVGTAFVGVAKGWRAQVAAAAGTVAQRRAARAHDAERPEIKAFEAPREVDSNSQRR